MCTSAAESSLADFQFYTPSRRLKSVLFNFFLLSSCDCGPFNIFLLDRGKTCSMRQLTATFNSNIQAARPLAGNANVCIPSPVSQVSGAMHFAGSLTHEICLGGME